VSKPLYQFLGHVFPKEHQWKIPLLSQWDEIIGSLRDKVVLEKIALDSLVLTVCHPSWAQELHVLAPLIKEKVNKVVGEGRIKHIRLRVGVIPPRRVNAEKAEPVAGEHGAQLTIQASQEVCLSLKEKKVLGKVASSDLRQELATFLTRCKQKSRKKRVI